MTTDRLAIIGAGGHGAVVVDALAGQDILVLDADNTRSGCDLLGVPIVVATDFSQAVDQRFHVAVGDNQTRGRIHTGLERDAKFAHTIIHPAAILSRHAAFGPGCFLAANAVIAARAELGRGVIVNHGAVVDHDCKVGDFCHIAPTACLGGGVTLGSMVLVGSGAKVLPGITVGDGVVIGSGAVVISDIPSGKMVTGVPAAPKTESQHHL